MGKKLKYSDFVGSHLNQGGLLKIGGHVLFCIKRGEDEIFRERIFKCCLFDLGNLCFLIGILGKSSLDLCIKYFKLPSFICKKDVLCLSTTTPQSLRFSITLRMS